MTVTHPRRKSETYNLTNIRSTPYPNTLLDVILTLPETQARIVSLIVRETLGWSGDTPGTRRAIVRLSYREIKERIGRNSSSVISVAVEELVSRGIVETLDGSNRVLLSAADRQRLRAPLWFRIARMYVEVSEPLSSCG